MRRDYCALTTSYFPWGWGGGSPHGAISGFVAQLSRLLASKWLSAHRVNTEAYVRSLMYIYMEGVTYRGLMIFPKRYDLLSMFPPAAHVDTPLTKLILHQIRTTRNGSDMTRMCDLLEPPI